MSLLVLQGGMLTTVQDLGRPGYQDQGVPVGGATDTLAARLTNLLVGNPREAALLEMALVGPELVCEQDLLVAWCGADFAVRLDQRLLPPNRPVRVPAGSRIHCGVARSGARAWLAVSGGLDVPVVLGSRSTLRRFGLGGWEGRALRPGDRLPVGSISPWARQVLESLQRAGRACADWSVPPSTLGKTRTEGNRLRVLRGPEWEWFRPEAWAHFVKSTYHVTKDADRMGVRLEGPLLVLREPRELISSAVDAGVVQVPASGLPIVLLCSRQTVGGYPRLAVVATVDQGRLAQLRQGDAVGFTEIDLATAHELVLAREADLRQVQTALAQRTG